MKMKTKIGTKLKTKMIASTGAVMMAAGLLVLSPLTAFAHCDTMQGPVISDAKKAIEENNINYILKWVTPENEAELTAIYEETMEVRDDSEGAKQLADEYLYENLVRIHRAGEGAAYTGLKDVTEVDEVVAAADESVETGSIDPLKGLVEEERIAEMEESLANVLNRKDFDVNDVEAGREYVEAYVTFIHLAEGEEEGEAHTETSGAHTETSDAHSTTEGAVAVEESETAAVPVWIPWTLAGIFFVTTLGSSIKIHKCKK